MLPATAAECRSEVSQFRPPIPALGGRAHAPDGRGRCDVAAAAWVAVSRAEHGAEELEKLYSECRSRAGWR